MNLVILSAVRSIRMVITVGILLLVILRTEFDQYELSYVLSEPSQCCQLVISFQ